jgi:3-hydroxyacyl-[acyl-carrier-protein] dehydratase
MILVDEVLEIDPGRRIVVQRFVRPDEPWFAGHFPGDPVLPGVLVAETLAQAAALLHLAAHPERAGETVYLAGIDGLRFRRVVRPGDTLRAEVVATGRKLRVVTFDVVATVDGQRCADGRLLAAVSPRAAPIPPAPTGG